MLEQHILERNIDSLNKRMATSLRRENPNITDAEIHDVAQNIIDFIGILRAMDMEQNKNG